MMTVHRTAGIRQWEFEKRIPLLFRDHRLFALCRRHARVKIGAHASLDGSRRDLEISPLVVHGTCPLRPRKSGIGGDVGKV